VSIPASFVQVQLLRSPLDQFGFFFKLRLKICAFFKIYTLFKKIKFYLSKKRNKKYDRLKITITDFLELKNIMVHAINHYKKIVVKRRKV